MQIFLFFALFISVLAVIFAVQNNTDATVTFAVWKFEESLALILLVALAAGALISFLFSLPSNIKTRWTLRQQRKRINDMETQLAGLRSQLEQAQLKETEKPAEILPVAEPIHAPLPLQTGAASSDAGQTLPEAEEPVNGDDDPGHHYEKQS